MLLADKFTRTQKSVINRHHSSTVDPVSLTGKRKFRQLWLSISFFLFINAYLILPSVSEIVSPGHAHAVQHGPAPAAEKRFSPDELIVKFKPSVEQDMAAAEAAKNLNISSVASLFDKYRVKSATPLYKKEAVKPGVRLLQAFKLW